MAHATLRTVEGYCIRQRVSAVFLLPCLAVLFTAFGVSEVAAAILGSSIEVSLTAQVRDRPPLSDVKTDSQGATTNPLGASFWQRTENGIAVIDHTFSATATFASQSRGRITHSYNGYLSNPNNDGETSRSYGLNALLDFTADSDQLTLGFAYRQSEWYGVFMPDLVRAHLYGGSNEYWYLIPGSLLDHSFLAGGCQTTFPLVPGADYTLQIQSFKFVGIGMLLDDFEFAWTTDGNSQENPILPDFQPPPPPPPPPPPAPPPPAPPFVFTRVLSDRWYDPPVATGYDFQTTDGSLFTSILDFPTGFNSPFTVTAGGNVLGQFGPGSSVDFTSLPGGGVSAFSISGIDPPTDPSDTLGFPIRLEFNNAIADFTMTPSSGVVPEPSSLLLWAVGSSILAGFAWRKRRRRAAC